MSKPTRRARKGERQIAETIARFFRLLRRHVSQETFKILAREWAKECCRPEAQRPERAA